MKIAYFVDGFPVVSETFVLAQITGMIRRGHDVTIFANKVVESGARHPVLESYKLMDKVVVRPIVRRNWLRRFGQGIQALAAAASNGRIGSALATLNGFRLGGTAFRMILLVRASVHYDHEDFDVLHCQFGQLGIEVAHLRRCGVLKGSLITSFRGADATRIASQKPEKFQSLFASGDLFLAVSVSIRDKLIEVGCPPEKIEILRSGVDLSTFSYRGPHEMHSPIRLITIGRLGPTKGHEYALEAVRDLVESGYSIEYRIVGDGALLQTLAEHVDELGLGAVVKFDGSVSSDSIVRLLCDADILVAPSIVAPTGQTEGVPNVLKEAMASGVPAIGTMVGGANELIDHGRNGYLVPQKDSKAIADCVRTIIAHQEDMPKILSRARQSIEQDYNLKQLNGDLEDAYIRAGSVH